MAKAWRRSVAHDHRHMDLAQTSLASRVCNGDGKLILSTDQASLLTQINAFVGLGHEDFELPWLQPGILLCMLCILLWCLYLCNELRAVFFSLEAVSFLPRGSRTILKQGRFIQMSYPRWLAYCLMRLARLSIAVALLYAGVLWLAGTTSITDLILNAVALSATLQVDEMIFAALMPKKIQINIQDLEAIKVKYSNARSQFESVVLLLLITGLMLWPYFSLVAPLAQDMLEVKRQYCAGNQDFVVGGNNMQKITVGFKTKPFNISEENSLSQFAVEDWIWRQDETVSNYILFKKELGEFDQQLSMPLSTLASFENTCEDWDATFLKGGTTESWQEQYRTHWFSTAFSLNMDLDSNCSEMRQHCDREDAGLLRYTCGHTCGCAYPYGNPWFRVTDSGCSDACKDAAEDYAATQICEDQNVTSQPLQDVWMTFWWYYLFMITYGVGLAHPNDLANNNQYADLYWRSLNMTELGCAGFLRVGWGEDPFLQSAFCEGSYVYRPLALLCPVSCGCTVSDPMPSYCPRSCKGCADGEEFPPQGQVTNCAQAAAVGLCEAYPAEALQLCAETCDLCHLLPGGARRLDSSRIAAVLQELDARARGGV
ncbi:unnamed protein product [Durusdinium trenchii]|uniref:Uncharacterized protein n=2 Tax=Durusdinium trenchii TaxID=1381693 RepID=A0ABP0PB37_9DINO